MGGASTFLASVHNCGHREPEPGQYSSYKAEHVPYVCTYDKSCSEDTPKVSYLLIMIDFLGEIQFFPLFVRSLEASIILID